ncbi:MAG: DUF4833 domain-containing protein, partial [Bacteroidota bacterium]|nr:DUF4833 domain-containing protein [Bacteroidota bacterium]
MSNPTQGFPYAGKSPVKPEWKRIAEIHWLYPFLYRNIRMLVFLSCMALFGDAMGQPGDFPVPQNNPNQLFYLQRPANTNTVIYELNAVNGVPDKKQPIHVFWIKYARNGEKEELTDLENKYAYGIKVT